MLFILVSLVPLSLQFIFRTSVIFSSFSSYAFEFRNKSDRLFGSLISLPKHRTALRIFGQKNITAIAVKTNATTATATTTIAIMVRLFFFLCVAEQGSARG